MAVADTTVLLKTSTDGFAVVVVPPKILRDWVHEAQVSIDDAGESRSAHRLALFDERDGALVGDRPAPGSPRERRTPTDTGLPWTIVVSPENPSASGEALAVRRSLLAIAAVMVLMAGGSYVLWSLVRRDLEVARQQTEFVSAVSHEFRTPLTSVRHVTELLQENDALPADRRRAFYDALGRNGERLHRLVESLLDFARMEGKRKPYDLQPIDVRTFVSQVVSDFRRSTPEDAAAVELAVDEPGVGSILADEGALATALWNLLDNAVKYSDRPANVHIGIARRRRDVVIEVRDRGFGIPPGEQTAIFRKFFRGRQPTALRIKGTGIGLAMVSYIVAAHGGRVELESKEGVGSAFRIVLPARQGHIANDRTVPTAREATLARPEAMFPFTGNPSPESRVPSPESRVPSPESRRLKPGA
jgi:signal transduction histidine kinase